eukprot:4836989-Pleurochrysis_carterae.AAC.1
MPGRTDRTPGQIAVAHEGAHSCARVAGGTHTPPCQIAHAHAPWGKHAHAWATHLGRTDGTPGQTAAAHEGAHSCVR